MVRDLQDHVALLGANDVRDLARFHGEGLVFQFFGKSAALENSQIAALAADGPSEFFLAMSSN